MFSECGDRYCFVFFPVLLKKTKIFRLLLSKAFLDNTKHTLHKYYWWSGVQIFFPLPCFSSSSYVNVQFVRARLHRSGNRSIGPCRNCSGPGIVPSVQELLCGSDFILTPRNCSIDHKLLCRSGIAPFHPGIAP